MPATIKDHQLCMLTLSTFNPLLNNNAIIILLLLNGFIHLYKSIKILLIGD